MSDRACEHCGTKMDRSNSTIMGHYPIDCRDALKAQVAELSRRVRGCTSLAYRAAAEVVANCFPPSDAVARLRSIAEDWRRTE